MGWIAALAVLGVLGALFYFYPKLMLIGAGVFGLIGAGIWGFLYLEEKAEKDKIGKVVMKATYNLKSCRKEYPIDITTVNGTKSTIIKRYFYLYGYKEGYSDAAYESEGWSNDRIIKAGEGFAQCWAVPKKNLDYGNKRPDPKDTRWVIRKGVIVFK